MLKQKPYQFPFENALRVIIDTDCGAECDDQYAVAHALMTPKFEIKGVISVHGVYEGTEQKNYEEIVKITKLMGVEGEVNILHGAIETMVDEYTPIDSEGARFIIEEAMKDDPRPLFICNQGAITNLASAYLLEPRIAEKVIAIWIGGGTYPNGGYESNMMSDYYAAKVIFKSNLKLWQIPVDVYSKMTITFTELLTKVYPYGEIGKYLFENTMVRGKDIYLQIKENVMKMMQEAKSSNKSLPIGNAKGTEPADADVALNVEWWSLGDSPCVGVLMNMGKWHVEAAPFDIYPDGRYDLSQPGNREIRVYDDINARAILEDMCAKFKFYFGE